MLEVRPIVVADGLVVGGNMRLRALQELGHKEVTILALSDWTQSQRDEFMIKDNLNFGDWDYDLLANEWEGTNLEDWGLDLWQDNFQDTSVKDLSNELNLEYKIEVEVSNEKEQESLYNDLCNKGYKCRILTL